MLLQKVIETVHTERVATIGFASNKDGFQRFCKDYRKLKDDTKQESYPIPITDIVLMLSRRLYCFSIQIELVVICK